MEELAHRRGRARLAIAFLAAAAVVSLRTSPGRAQEGTTAAPGAPGSPPGAGQGQPPVASSIPEPIRVFTDARGRTCRVYERRVLIDGTPSTALGTICRDPSGRWVLSR
jgi:surface antigen